MRVYVFTHAWLSPLQKGLQSAHAVAELLIKFPSPSSAVNWAFDHKTLILLDGGNTAMMRDTYNAVIDSPHPSAMFCEDDESMGAGPHAGGRGMMTAIAVCVSTKDVDLMAEVRDMPYLKECFKGTFLERIYNARLAS